MRAIVEAIGNSEERRGKSADEIAGRVIKALGFTRKDVEYLRVLVAFFDDDADNYETTGVAAVWFKSLADRLEALLPPEGE